MELKVHDDETPSQTIIKKSTETVYVIDDLGRKLGIREPNFLRQKQYTRIFDDETPQRTLNAAFPVVYLVSIDDDTVSLPKNELQLDALLSRLDNAGMTAITKGIVKHFSDNVSPEMLELQNLLPKLNSEMIKDLYKQAKQYAKMHAETLAALESERLKKPQPTTA